MDAIIWLPAVVCARFHQVHNVQLRLVFGKIVHCFHRVGLFVSGCLCAIVLCAFKANDRATENVQFVRVLHTAMLNERKLMQISSALPNRSLLTYSFDISNRILRYLFPWTHPGSVRHSHTPTQKIISITFV